MPIHLEPLNIEEKTEGLSSAMIAACNMCAGASLAMKKNKPFIEFFSSLLKSPPLERYIVKLESILNERGVKTHFFRAGMVQQFFLCLWTSRQREKLRKSAQQYDAVIVLGCDSAIKTVRSSLEGTGCKVIKGMEVAGVMNTRPKFHLPCNISFEYSEIVPICDRHCNQMVKTATRDRRCNHVC